MPCVLKYLFTPGFILRCSSAIAADQMLLHPYLPYTYCKIYTPSCCSISKKINYSRGSGLASPAKEGLRWYNTGFCPHVMICEAICQRPRQTKRQMTPNEKANVTSPMTPIKYRETPKSSGPSEGHHLPSSSWSSTHVAHVAYNHAKFSMVLCMHFNYQLLELSKCLKPTFRIQTFAYLRTHEPRIDFSKDSIAIFQLNTPFDGPV